MVNIILAIADVKRKLQTCEGRIELAEQAKKEQSRLSKRSEEYRNLQTSMYDHLYMAYCRVDRDKAHIVSLIRERGGPLRASDLETAIRTHEPKYKR